MASLIYFACSAIFSIIGIMTFLQKIAQVAGWLAVFVIAILSLVPGSLRPHSGAPPKLEHVAAYLVAAGLLTFGYGKRYHPLVVALCLSIYSAALEAAQILVPDRNASLSDIAASSTGAVIGSTLAWIVLRAFQRVLAPSEPIIRNQKSGR